jgi:hypothetical protein
VKIRPKRIGESDSIREFLGAKSLIARVARKAAPLSEIALFLGS